MRLCEIGIDLERALGSGSHPRIALGRRDRDDPREVFVGVGEPAPGARERRIDVERTLKMVAGLRI